MNELTNMEWYIYLIVIITGFFVGFINTLAGSGSLLSLPLLIFIGLPANIANGTNRIGILLQSLVASFSFQKSKVFEWKKGLKLSIPAIFGSVIGAFIAVDLNENIMNKTIGVLMVLMFFLVLLKPEQWIKGSVEETDSLSLKNIIIFFLIGIYGGFIQAGVGFFLLAGLVFGAGFNLVKANALKVLIVCFFTPFALTVFIINNQVDYILGFLLACGNIIGAYVAVKLAVRKGATFIRYFLLVVLLLSAIKLFNLFNFTI